MGKSSASQNTSTSSPCERIGAGQMLLGHYGLPTKTRHCHIPTGTGEARGVHHSEMASESRYWLRQPTISSW